MGCQGRLFFVFIPLRFASVRIFSTNLFLNLLSPSSIETSLLLNPCNVSHFKYIPLQFQNVHRSFDSFFIINFNCLLKLSFNQFICSFLHCLLTFTMVKFWLQISTSGSPVDLQTIAYFSSCQSHFRILLLAYNFDYGLDFVYKRMRRLRLVEFPPRLYSFLLGKVKSWAGFRHISVFTYLYCLLKALTLACLSFLRPPRLQDPSFGLSGPASPLYAAQHKIPLEKIVCVWSSSRFQSLTATHMAIRNSARFSLLLELLCPGQVLCSPCAQTWQMLLERNSQPTQDSSWYSPLFSHSSLILFKRKFLPFKKNF